MRYIEHPFRQADIILNSERLKPYYDEVLKAVADISDQDIRDRTTSRFAGKMSLSHAINDLLKERLAPLGWLPEAPIFQDPEYSSPRETKWRLDFAKGPVSIEVAFNHGEAIAWNLLKPVLASEQNHVRKAIQTEIGIVIAATSSLKKAGAFDSAVGEFEKICRYLKPLSTILSVPLMIIGLEAPESFAVKKEKVGNKNIGTIIDIDAGAEE